MSDPNDVWQNGSSGNGYSRDREGSPRRDEPVRSPRRDRSRSPGARPAGNDNRGRGEDAQVANPGNNLHVSGLARVITEAQLIDYFSKAGKVAKCQIMMDPHTQESRGFGFVMMETGEEAQAAIEQYNGQNIEGKTLTVAHARRGRARTPTPGRYHGVKIDPGPRYPPYGGGGGGYDRPYQPRSYDSRYSDRGPPPPRGYDDRRYDDRRFDDRRVDDRRDYRDPRDSRDRRDDYYARDAPDRERGGYERRDERPRYDDRPRYTEERPRY
ncbi:hypothetical protein IAU60_003283 [Kwoniella sp. DSM 27419]